MPAARTTVVRAWLAGALLAVLAGCSTVPDPARPPEASARPPARPSDPATTPADPYVRPGEPGPGASAPARPQEPAARPSKPGRPGPIADRPINLQGRCTQSEDDGYREQATLDVRDNQVQALAWELWVGKRGSCRFDQADFRQVKSRPHIELHARDGSGCKLMVWQDPRRITLAHAGCERRCSPGIYQQAWPVMFDAGTGRCARL
jgi:hypothetical protein